MRAEPQIIVSLWSVQKKKVQHHIKMGAKLIFSGAEVLFPSLFGQKRSRTSAERRIRFEHRYLYRLCIVLQILLVLHTTKVLSVFFCRAAPQREEEESSSSDEETAQEKRLRLAKKHIEDLKNKGAYHSSVSNQNHVRFTRSVRESGWFWVAKRIASLRGALMCLTTPRFVRN